MEIDQLTTFVAVATVGGFHRAAETLRVSQPAVSARIKALEDSLGSPLFARARSGLTLTEAGRILRPFAEQLLKTASQARQAGTNSNRLVAGRCRSRPHSPSRFTSCLMSSSDSSVLIPK